MDPYLEALVVPCQLFCLWTLLGLRMWQEPTDPGNGLPSPGKQYAYSKYEISIATKKLH